MADPRTEYTCPVCDADDIRATLAGKLRFHKTNGERCDGSGRAVTQLPPEAPECNDTPQEPVSSATCSRTSDTGDPPPETHPPTTDTRTTETTTADNSPGGHSDEPTPARTVETLPGVDQYTEDLGDLATQQLEAYRAKVDRDLAEFAGVDVSNWPRFDQPLPPPPVEQPPLFDQPSQAGRAPKVWAETVPMTPLGQQIAHRLKEMFHAYSNRMERNQQPTMGPSEIGTPCDRRIALSLMRFPTVNPGGDNWASFVGTCGHTGIEEMFMWADAGSGRYAPEVRLQFPSKHVPFGTTDLIDRVLLAVLDHKFMGQWSLDKLKSSGPSRTYRVQAHTYAYGAAMRGERVKHVAIVGWPRDKGNLDDLYVWTEEYDPDVARQALKRVDDIAARVLVPETAMVDGMPVEQVAPADDPYSLPMDNTDCRFCPFYMKGAARSEGGVCNGRG